MESWKVLLALFLGSLFFFNVYFSVSSVMRMHDDHQRTLERLEKTFEGRLHSMGSELLESVNALKKELKQLRSDQTDLVARVETQEQQQSLVFRAIDRQEDGFSRNVQKVKLEVAQENFEEGVVLPLREWYNDWRLRGHDLSEPLDDVVKIFIASDQDVVSRFIRQYGSWVCSRPALLSLLIRVPCDVVVSVTLKLLVVFLNHIL